MMPGQERGRWKRWKRWLRCFLPQKGYQRLEAVYHRCYDLIGPHWLAWRIRRKWQIDSAQLPLTQEHWELYVILHEKMNAELKRFPDLVNCRDFNDRIQWLKLFDQREEIVSCCDKILVRELVAKRVGEHYLTELYQTAPTFEEIRLETLPKSFVIKTNHDSGSVILVRDKNAMNWAQVKEQLNTSLRRCFGWEQGEWAYAFIKPALLVEEYINPHSDTPPPDYKFYVVEGRTKFVHYIYDRGIRPREQVLDPEGRSLNTPLYPSFELGSDFVKPSCWDQMREVAEKVGGDFKCVRVDLFENRGRIMVGELTFWPMYGCYDGEGQKKLGPLLEFDRTTFREPVYHRLKRCVSPA